MIDHKHGKQEILNRLDKAKFYQELIPSLKSNGKPNALGLCPEHGDTHPSLSVNLETGFFRCFSCDFKGDIFTFYQKYKDCDFPTALKEIGAMVGVADTNVKPKVVATFKYYDSEGKLLYIKERIEPGRNGKNKEFVFKHLENGKWTLRRGCDPVLYNLPELTKSKYCFIVEGEGKVDLLNSWGFTATCLDSGASSLIKDEYIQILGSMEKVVIFPDNDTPGRNYACKIANSLLGKVKELKVVELPGLQEKEDIIDWVKIPGNNKEKLVEIIKNTTAWVLDKRNIDQPKNKAKVLNCTDLGNAWRFVSQHGGDKIRCCFAWKKWLCWNDKAWDVDNDGQILRLAKKTVHNIYREAYESSDPDLSERLGKWGAKSQAKDRIMAMIKLAESEEGIPISPNKLDINPYLLNCRNGTIDLRTGKLLQHDPKDFITKIIPVEYHPEATCELWIEFLEKIMNWNYDLIQFLQRAIGYSLTGDTSEQCLFLLHGTGANGKSTLLNILNLLLGDFAQTASFETFLLKNQERINNDIARMQGRRFISAIEAEGERRLSEVVVKQLTGGDIVTARFLFAEFFEFKPQFKMWLACNHKPIIRGTDHAIWRRIKLIPFNVTISEAERDKHLTEKLQAELPGILAWTIKGCLEWQKEGLKTPNEVRNATNEYQGEMDVIQAFLDDRCFTKIDAKDIKTISSKLYEAYAKWCSENGETPLNNNSFGRRLSEKGFMPSQSGGKRWRQGVGLSTEVN